MIDKDCLTSINRNTKQRCSLLQDKKSCGNRRPSRLSRFHSFLFCCNRILCLAESPSYLFDHCPQDDPDGNGQEHGGNGGFKEPQEAAVSVLHAPDQVLFHFFPQHQAQDHGSLGIFVLAHEVADDPEHQGGPHVEHIVVGAVGTYHAQYEDNGEQDVFGNVQDPDKGPDAPVFHHQHHYRGHHQPGKQAVDQFTALLEQQRTGDDAMEHQATQDNGSYRIPGDSQGQQRNQSPADGGVVGGFGSHNAIHAAGTEFFRMLALLFGHTVGHNIGRSAADPRQDADADADQGGPDEVHELVLEFLESKPKAFDFVFQDLAFFGFHPFCSCFQDFSRGKKPDHHWQLGKSVFQFRNPESEPGGTGDVGNPEQGNHDAEDPGHHRFERVVGNHGSDHSQREETDGKGFNGAELQSSFRQRRSNEEQSHHGKNGSQEGVENADAQGPAPFTPFRHGRPVKGGGHGRGCAGDFQQDGGNQTAGSASHIQGNQHGNPVKGRHPKGNGQTQGHRHGGSEPGYGPKDDPHNDPYQDNQQGCGIQYG